MVASALLFDFLYMHAVNVFGGHVFECHVFVNSEQVDNEFV